MCPSPQFSNTKIQFFEILFDPPELDFILGLVTTLYDRIHEEYENHAEEWADSRHLQRRMTRGSQHLMETPVARYFRKLIFCGEINRGVKNM